MRQRNIKNLDEKIAVNSRFLIEEPKACKGRWAEIFGNDKPIYLEIGCGKGKFITSHALEESHCNFIACEGQASVVLRALEKAEEAGLENLRIFITFVHDLKDYFEEGELAGIYLNFSDPWPKARHAKRRLTYRGRLANYKEVLKKGGFIEFKTDNEGLFEFSLEEIREMAYPIEEMTRNLHNVERLQAEDGDESRVHQDCAKAGIWAEKSSRFTTEYEDKFSSMGKNINFVRF